VLGKLIPKALKRRNTFRIVQAPTESHENRHKVLVTSQFLANMSLQDTRATVDRITSIMRELGDQFEEEIASKEVWRELSNRLQRRDKLYNYRDRRKLSHVNGLHGMALMKLRDGRIKQD